MYIYIYIYIYIYTHIFCRPTLPPDDGLIESKHAVEFCTNQVEELIFIRWRQKQICPNGVKHPPNLISLNS
jgi:hypothetical protein